MLPLKSTLAIVDDHPIVIEGIIKLLSKVKQFDIVGTFTNGQDFIQFFKTTSVNVVLLDIILPDVNGMDLCKEIKAMNAATVVLALSNHQERSAIMKMLENGANGYLLKNASTEELNNCIMEALNGQIAFSQAVKEIIAKPQVNMLTEPIKLTVREKEILKLIASGITTQRIAEMLFLSKFTVENHRKNILQKFGSKNFVELINTAIRQGLL